MNLTDTVVIVTGGGRGLGATYARGLAAEGATVIAADIADTTEVVHAITAAGGTAVGRKVDITDESAVETLAAEIAERHGRIDVLVNNAAYFRAAQGGSFETLPISELERCLAVNVIGTWQVTRAVLPYMKDQGHGKIINVSSASVWKGTSATGPHYLTSKAALIGLTRALARELGKYNINVNTLVPDAIPEPSDDPGDNPAESRQVLGRCFQRRQTPEDMVGTLVYLCSRGSDFVTGQSLHVNGGSYLT